MPFNESTGKKRSNLTKEQQRQALAAIYGLSPERQPIPTPSQKNMDVNNLTPEQVAQMRSILEQIDAKTSRVPKEFDINKPEKLPYVHQPFPCMVYHHAKRKHQAAANEKELAIALEKGWSKEPYPAVDADTEVELSLKDQAEAAAIDAALKAGKKK